MSKKGKRLPSSTCSLCNKTLQEVGGCRVVYSPMVGVIISQGEQKISQFAHTIVNLVNVNIIKLQQDCCQSYLVVWGKWTREAIEKACAEIYAHNRPWVCQLCAGYKCSKCKEKSSAMPPGADVLGDNGEILHSPILPVPMLCKDCNEARSDQ